MQTRDIRLAEIPETGPVRLADFEIHQVVPPGAPRPTRPVELALGEVEPRLATTQPVTTLQLRVAPAFAEPRPEIVRAPLAGGWMGGGGADMPFADLGQGRRGPVVVIGGPGGNCGPGRIGIRRRSR